MEMKRRNTPDGVRIEVVHTGTNEDQNWGAKHVQEWAEEGWMVVGDDTITILTVDDQPDLVYDIKRRPGYYAKATGERIPLSDVAMTQFMTKSLATLAPQQATAWLLSKGLSGGYEATRNYECTLSKALHAKFKKGA